MKWIIIFFLSYCWGFPLLAQTDRVTYHDTTIVDNYQWLEAINTSKTKLWLKGQKSIEKDFLRKARVKSQGLAYLTDYSNNRFDLPIKEGQHFYKFLSYHPDYSPALYFQDKLRSQALQFIVPNDISSKDEISICDFKESPDGKYLAFSFSRNGSPCDEISIKKIIGKYLKDHLTETNLSNMEWKNDGFFYLKYPPTENFEPWGNPALMYHRLGTQQEADELIYRRKSNQVFDLKFSVTPNQDYLIIKEFDNLRKRYTIFIKNLNQPEESIQPLFVNSSINIDIIFNEGEVFFAQTDFQSGLNSIISFHLNDPKTWNQIIPPYEDALLVWAKMANHQLICKYQVASQPILSFYSFKGELLHSIPFAAGYGLDLFVGPPSDDKAVLYYTSYFFPPISMEIDLNDYSTEVVEKMKAGYFKVADYEIEATTYTSKDGTAVPITIVYKKGMVKDGYNPTLLKTFGGFGHIHFPSFDPGLIHFMEQGGVFAYCYSRGEGVLGKEWREQGQNLDKQNAIDDFIAAAEFLIAEGYTNSMKLASTGTSNGALIVTSAALQRPNLFKAVVPRFGVFDLLELDQFTLGATLKEEYGTTENEYEFETLFSYSPLQNIQQGIEYPAMLIFTAENDNYFPPIHSYKLVARLQDNIGQINPIILRIEENAGHQGAVNWSDRQLAAADMYSFLMELLWGEDE